MELCSWENPRVPRGRISLKIHGHHVVNMGNIWVNLGKCGKHVVNTYVNSQGQKKTCGDFMGTSNHRDSKSHCPHDVHMDHGW
jgi:hypothetical protein